MAARKPRRMARANDLGRLQGDIEVAISSISTPKNNFEQGHTERLEMSHYLLTGAGFSRNWGGWLANEAFEYLLGAPETDHYIRDILWATKLKGEGFEGALSIVQGEYEGTKSAEAKGRLDRLTEAVVGMFSAMQTAFNKLDYRELDLRLQRFLAQFDGIFTLNQDTLLETLYAGEVRWSERWYGSYLPYMKFANQSVQPYPFMLREPMMPGMPQILLK